MRIIKIKILILIAIVAIIAAALFYFTHKSDKADIEVRKGDISRIEAMVQLCALDIYSEVPVLDTINDKVMFAVQKQRGSISFDLENLDTDMSGDTIRITLPPEIIELHEATDKNSWEVIDTKAIGPLAFLRSDKMTVEEENAIKANIERRSKRLLYRNGTVKRARSEGAATLQSLMEKAYRKPVKVTDPTPQGACYDRYQYTRF